MYVCLHWYVTKTDSTESIALVVRFELHYTRSGDLHHRLKKKKKYREHRVLLSKKNEMKLRKKGILSSD